MRQKGLETGILYAYNPQKHYIGYDDASQNFAIFNKKDLGVFHLLISKLSTLFCCLGKLQWQSVDKEAGTNNYIHGPQIAHSGLHLSDSYVLSKIQSLNPKDTHMTLFGTDKTINANITSITKRVWFGNEVKLSLYKGGTLTRLFKSLFNLQFDHI